MGSIKYYFVLPGIFRSDLFSHQESAQSHSNIFFIKNWPFVTENVLCIQTNTDDIVALLWYLKPFGWVLLNEVPFELMSFMYAVKRVLEQEKIL